MENQALSRLSDTALVAEVERLARTERDATLALIVHLAELGARQLHLAAGFPSLFMYCREVLKLSEGEAYTRVVASRAVRRFPIVLDRLIHGSINLTTVRLLYKHLTTENYRELLDTSVGLSKREVERLIAARFSQPAVAFSVRRVAAAAVPVERSLDLCPDAEPTPAKATMEVAQPTGALPVPAPILSPPMRPATVQPISADQYNVRFTASADTWDMLQAARDLLRHAVPDGDISQIVGRALKLLLADLARKKFGATTRPRESQGTKPGSRAIAAEVRRTVSARDGERCAFVSASGRRCAERGHLEFHHKRPYAVGGEATVENIELRCRSHNLHEAKLFFGYMREGTDLVREAIPGWDVSATLSSQALGVSSRPGDSPRHVSDGQRPT
jgi:hypothetical protein